MSDSIITLKNVSVSYEGIPVLEDVSFSVTKGEYVALLGPNGAGKSTLIKLILGLIKYDNGEITVFGKSPDDLSFRERQKIGYVPQFQDFDRKFPLSVQDVVLMGRYSKLGWFKRPHDEDWKAVDQALQYLEINNIRNMPIGWLSGGQRQRILIARALAARPELLILDEPTTSLDIPTTEGLYNLIDDLRKKMGLTVIVVSHDVGVVVNMVDTIACLAGRLVAHGKPSEALTSQTLECMYGEKSTLFGHGHLPHVMVKRHEKKGKGKSSSKT